MVKIEEKLSLKNMTFVKPWKQIVFFSVGCLGLIGIQIVASIILSLIAREATGGGVQYDTFIRGTTSDMILNVTCYMILAIVFIILASPDSEEFFKTFRHWQPYVAGAVGLAAIMTFNIVYGNILAIIGVGVTDNANESGLNSIVTDFPFTSLFIFALVGPICEEITYRVGLFSFFRRINVILAYAITIIGFTLIHFDFDSSNIVNELLNLPYYAFAAFTFTFLYEKYGFAASTSAHVSNNLISILATILGIFKL